MPTLRGMPHRNLPLVTAFATLSVSAWSADDGVDRRLRDQEISQRSIATHTAGTAEELRDIADSLRFNGLVSPEEERQLADLTGQLGRLTDTGKTDGQPNMLATAEALAKARETKGAADLAKAAGDAARLVTVLDDVLGKAGHKQLPVSQRIRGLREKQERLNADTLAQADKTLGKEESELSEAEKSTLGDLADRQQELSREMQGLRKEIQRKSPGSEAELATATRPLGSEAGDSASDKQPPKDSEEAAQAMPKLAAGKGPADRSGSPDKAKPEACKSSADKRESPGAATKQTDADQQASHSVAQAEKHADDAAKQMAEGKLSEAQAMQEAAVEALRKAEEQANQQEHSDEQSGEPASPEQMAKNQEQIGQLDAAIAQLDEAAMAQRENLAATKQADGAKRTEANKRDAAAQDSTSPAEAQAPQQTAAQDPEGQQPAGSEQAPPSAAELQRKQQQIAQNLAKQRNAAAKPAAEAGQELAKHDLAQAQQGMQKTLDQIDQARSQLNQQRQLLAQQQQAALQQAMQQLDQRMAKLAAAMQQQQQNLGQSQKTDAANEPAMNQLQAQQADIANQLRQQQQSQASQDASQAKQALGQMQKGQAEQAMQQAMQSMQKAQEQMQQQMAQMQQQSQQLAQHEQQAKDQQSQPPDRQPPTQGSGERNETENSAQPKARDGKWQVALEPGERERLTHAAGERFPGRYERQLSEYYRSLGEAKAP